MNDLHWETLTRLVHRHDDQLKQLEDAMTATDDMVRRLDTATNEIAADLDRLRDEVSGLDPAIAAKFEPLVTRLEALGQDPANPIPAPDPNAPPA